MQHLNEEQLVLHHYGESDVPHEAEQHLHSCKTCRDQYDTVRRVLAAVSDVSIPEKGEAYGTEVWNRLRWKLKPQRSSRRVWQSMLAAAAMIAVAFFAGHLWRDRQSSTTMATATTPAPSGTATAAPGAGDRLLLVVVSDHLDSSERILLELVNADPSKGLDLSGKQQRVGELVASNRIYRQSAQLQGEKRIASVLTDLEPILVELANAPEPSLDEKKLTGLQKRIDTRGLLFKVRVVGAEALQKEPAPTPDNIDTL